MRRAASAFLPALLPALLAVALQIQLTLFHSETYLGLRVALSDLMLPAFILCGGIWCSAWFFDYTRLPALRAPLRPWLFAALSVIIVIAMAHGFIVQGHLSSWALVNKFIGWFILLAYFYLGALMRAQGGDAALRRFVMASFLMLLCAGGLEILNQVLKVSGLYVHYKKNWMYMEGFMANRNAFAFLLATMTGFAAVYGAGPAPLIRRHWAMLFWFMFPMMVFFNSSRALTIVTVPIAALLFYIDWKNTLKTILPCIAAGIIAFFLIFSAYQTTHFTQGSGNLISAFTQFAQNGNHINAAQIIKSTGDDDRLRIVHSALNVVRAYPALGAGLGSAQYFQERDYGSVINVIDDTPLWILTDMGALGLTAFLTVFFCMIASLRRAVLSAPAGGANFEAAALIMLMSFSIFCLFHEILYTRFFWVILGMALTQRPDELALQPFSDRDREFPRTQSCSA